MRSARVPDDCIMHTSSVPYIRSHSFSYSITLNHAKGTALNLNIPKSTYHIYFNFVVNIYLHDKLDKNTSLGSHSSVHIQIAFDLDRSEIAIRVSSHGQKLSLARGLSYPPS